MISVFKEELNRVKFGQFSYDLNLANTAIMIQLFCLFFSLTSLSNIKEKQTLSSDTKRNSQPLITILKRGHLK